MQVLSVIPPSWGSIRRRFANGIPQHGSYFGTGITSKFESAFIVYFTAGKTSKAGQRRTYEGTDCHADKAAAPARLFVIVKRQLRDVTFEMHDEVNPGPARLLCHRSRQGSKYVKWLRGFLRSMNERKFVIVLNSRAT